MFKAAFKPARKMFCRQKSGHSCVPFGDSKRQKESAFRQDLPLEECSFTVLDTELTGLNYRSDEIVSIGGVRIRNLSIVPEDIFYAEVRPSRLPKNCTLIHGISPEQVKKAPELAAILPDLFSFVGQDYIIGHNIGLDMAFLNKACKKYVGTKLKNPCIDTLRMARTYCEQLWQNYFDHYSRQLSLQLNDLAREFGLPEFGRHNAFQDALQTAYLFLFLIRKISNGHVKNLKELYALERTLSWM